MDFHDDRFLVLGVTGVVLRDLISTVKDAFETLEATVAHTQDEAMHLLEQGQQLKYAFLNLSPETLMNSELVRLCEKLGAKIVLLGTDAEDAVENSPHPVLVRPFATHDILRVLEGANCNDA